MQARAATPTRCPSPCCRPSPRSVACGGIPRRHSSSLRAIARSSSTSSCQWRVKVYSTNEAGKDLIVAVHGPGEYVGELALDGSARSASVMTLEPSTFSVVRMNELRGLIAAHPDFALSLINKLIWRVRQATEGMKSMGLDDVYKRIVRLLHDFSDPQGDVRVVRARPTQQDIADRIGASREMVSRVLKELVTGQYVDVDAGRITILTELPRSW